MKITIADDLLQGVGLTPERARLELAVGLFSDRKVTLGRGAEIAGIPQAEFMRELGRRKIPMHYDIEEFEEDLRTLKQLRGK